MNWICRHFGHWWYRDENVRICRVCHKTEISAAALARREARDE